MADTPDNGSTVYRLGRLTGKIEALEESIAAQRLFLGDFKLDLHRHLDSIRDNLDATNTKLDTTITETQAQFARTNGQITELSRLRWILTGVLLVLGFLLWRLWDVVKIAVDVWWKGGGH